MSKIYKHGSLDKFDGYMPNKSHWIHDDYYVSSCRENIHTSTAYGYRDPRSRGFRFGVDKKMYKASGCGINIDSYTVGKADST